MRELFSAQVFKAYREAPHVYLIAQKKALEFTLL